MKYFDNTSLKDIYPETPDDIKDMIKKTVDEQIQIAKPKKSHRYIRVAGICAGVVFAVSGTAYAAKILSKLNVEKVGNYGAEISVSTATDNDAVTEVPEVALELKNLPEGYVPFQGYQNYASGSNVASNIGKIIITDEAYNMDKEHVTMYVYSLPDGYESFKVLDAYVSSTEEFEVANGHGIYMEYSSIGMTVSMNMTSKIYIIYPELNHLVEIVGFNNICKEDMYGIANSIDITRASEKPENFYTDTIELHAGEAPFWVNEENQATNNVYYENQKNASELANTYGVIDKAEFSNRTHKIGEELRYTKNWSYNNISYMDEEGMFGVKISDVSVYDKLVGESEALTPETLQYIKFGDGIDVANEVVKTETKNMKFVLVTMDITNYCAGNNINYCYDPGLLLRVKEDGDKLRLYNNNSALEDGIDRVEGKYYTDSGLPCYIYNGVDVEERNYINNFSEGETRTVYSGFYVAEDELSDMYLELVWSTEDNLSFGYIMDSDGNYSSPALENGGFFDIRQ